MDYVALFRHDRYYLNIQRTPVITPKDVKSDGRVDAGVCFNVLDTQHWNAFPFPIDAEHRHAGCKVLLGNLLKNTEATLETEIELELGLKDCVTRWREESGLITQFDDELSILLQPALAAYEFDRCTGVSFGNTDFQASIKRYNHLLS